MRDYQTKSNVGGVPDSITATKYGAGEFNSLATENEIAVSSSGQTLAPADGAGESTDQLARAMAIYGAGGAEFHNDTGIANAYVLNPVSPRKSPPAYFDGFTVTFEPGNDNTGASTVNVASLGVKSIVDLTGAPLIGGEISGSVTIRYDLALGEFILIYSSALSTGSTGKVVQIVNTQSGAVITGTPTKTIPLDDTIPQNDEGLEVLTLSITPTKSSNILMIDVVLVFAVSVITAPIGCLFQDSTADALASAVGKISSGQDSVTLTFRHWMTAGTTSSTTFKTRAGAAAGVVTVNGNSGTRKLGGSAATSITITEIES